MLRIILDIKKQYLTLSFFTVGKLKAGAQGISLIKGFAIIPTGGIQLISEIIHDALGGIPVSVLMGANLANEVANGSFCETTIGCNDQTGKSSSAILRFLFTYFI